MNADEPVADVVDARDHGGHPLPRRVAQVRVEAQRRWQGAVYPALAQVGFPQSSLNRTGARPNLLDQGFEGTCWRIGLERRKAVVARGLAKFRPPRIACFKAALSERGHNRVKVASRKTVEQQPAVVTVFDGQ
jgi:hypothetical protein